eukprot:NODE_95_length_21460_cov_0.300220.p11 type:complete len:209 gc:universal NODE_95_length_21460_cov_0.300220:10523-9897(-)
MPQSLSAYYSCRSSHHQQKSQDNVDNLIMILRANIQNERPASNPFENLLNPVMEKPKTQTSHQVQHRNLTLKTHNLDISSDENISPSPKSPKNYTTVHGSEGVQYICLLCDNVFKHKPDVIRHTKNVHSNREACKWCSKLLKTTGRSDAKRKHLENCSGFLKNLPKDISKEKIHRIIRAIVGDKRRKHQPMTPIDDDCNELIAYLLRQ